MTEKSFIEQFPIRYVLHRPEGREQRIEMPDDRRDVKFWIAAHVTQMRFWETEVDALVIERQDWSCYPLVLGKAYWVGGKRAAISDYVMNVIIKPKRDDLFIKFYNLELCVVRHDEQHGCYIVEQHRKEDFGAWFGDWQ